MSLPLRRSIRLSPPLREKLALAAEKESDRLFKFVSMNDIVRMALVEYLERYEEKYGKLK